MDCDATIYHRDGTSDLVMYRGEPMTAIMAHARLRVEAGALRVEVRDLDGKLINQHPRVLHGA